MAHNLEFWGCKEGAQLTCPGCMAQHVFSGREEQQPEDEVRSIVTLSQAGRIQFKVLTTLPLKFKGFQDKNLKSKFTNWERH